MSLASAFGSFDAFAETIELDATRVLRQGVQSTGPAWQASESISSTLRDRVAWRHRHAAGTFLTSDALSSVVVSELAGSQTLYDPACGTGNLLLSHVTRLPILGSLDSTIDMWGERITGCEIQEPLLRVARARVALAAAERFRLHGGRFGKTRRSLQRLFPQLTVRDGLQASEFANRADAIILNPPYTLLDAPAGCEWSSGKTSAAALFVERCLKQGKPGARLVAVLPDVLRSGARYRAWRAVVASLASIESVEVVGGFDEHTDVDVFVLRATVRPGGVGDGAPWVALHRGVVLGDFASVTVGPLVAYREPNLGRWARYLDVASATPWERVSHLDSSRRFRGVLAKPPFVVVRRTSSPHDKVRAIATLIVAGEPVAVENHLVVLRPHDGTLSTCEDIFGVLRRPSTTEWLNQRIRCRHLTTDAVREIPWK